MYRIGDRERRFYQWVSDNFRFDENKIIRENEEYEQRFGKK